MTAFFQNLGMPFEGAWLLSTIIGILVIALPLMLAVAMIIYADRKIWAAMALRRGPNVVGPFGLLQSFADGAKVNVVYVWDILDANGVRLHRLQGQETVAAKGSDPWAAVTDRVMQDIAAKTLNDYSSWKQSQQG